MAQENKVVFTALIKDVVWKSWDTFVFDVIVFLFCLEYLFQNLAQ